VEAAAQQQELEQVVRRRALQLWLQGQEEQALDLLAVARALAPPTSRSLTIGSNPMRPTPKIFPVG
jgi:hypothetical protein